MILFIFSTFCIKFGTGDFNKNLIGSFLKIGPMKAIVLLRGINVFLPHALHIYCPLSVTFGTRDLNIMLLSIQKFCENRHKGGHTFLKKVNEITLTHEP